jgi:hypothetical protein
MDLSYPACFSRNSAIFLLVRTKIKHKTTLFVVLFERFFIYIQQSKEGSCVWNQPTTRSSKQRRTKSLLISF